MFDRLDDMVLILAARLRVVVLLDNYELSGVIDQREEREEREGERDLAFCVRERKRERERERERGLTIKMGEAGTWNVDDVK